MADSAIGATFKITRILQAACMVAIIGMTSNFVAEIVAAEASPPSVLIGTLSVVCVAVLYCVITFILYLDKLLPFFIAAIVDCLFLIALIVVSVVVGKPLSYLNCGVVGKLSEAGTIASTLDGIITQASSDGQYGSKGTVKYASLIGTSKSTCLEMKSIWGLSIALCILFTLSATTAACLWKQARKTAAPVKGEA